MLRLLPLLLSATFFYLPPFSPVYALKALSPNLRCEVHFFEAHFKLPPGNEKIKDEWPMPEEMHKIFARAPLSAYSHFRKITAELWHLTILKPQRHEYPFLRRYELTYLEARTTSTGQAVYRFEHKVGHMRSVEFTFDALEPHGIFIQHAVTHDQFLHLTCLPE